MLFPPIRIIPQINSFSQLVQHSIRLQPPNTAPLHPKQFARLRSDYYIFALEDGTQYITVSWFGINPRFFQSYGYEETNTLNLMDKDVDFLDKYSIQTTFLWEQAMLQHWTYAFEQCHQLNLDCSRKILPVEITEPVEIHDVTFQPYSFTIKDSYMSFSKETRYTCYGMVSCYPNLVGVDNCGTFIFGKTFLLVCDEYGRTFFISKTENMISLSPIVDRLLQANYTFTKNPDNYVVIKA